MSPAEDVVVDSAALPCFDLEYGMDDPTAPSWVTVFDPDAEDVSTTWITMDARHTVPLGDVA